MTGDALFARMSRAVQQILRDGDTPGAGVALLADGEPLFAGGIGFRDVGRTQQLVDDARFYIYSITKTMVAVAILQLVEQGRLVLDLSIQRYVPHLPIATPITLRQLLNHSGGLPDYGALPAYNDALRAHPQHPWSPAQFLKETLQDELLFAPGQGWRYSNIGYLLLVMALEAVQGAPLHAVLQQQIFTPLDLHAMTVAQTLDGAEKLSPGYTTFLSEDGALEDIRTCYHPGWVAHGLVVSTATELARFLWALFDGRLLGAKMLEVMRQPLIVPTVHPFFKQPAYGLGLMLDPQTPYGLVAGHGGGGPGYSAAAFAFADVAGCPVIGVALANRDQPDLGLKIAFTLVDLLATQD